jgi:hypothetical protein
MITTPETGLARRAFNLKILTENPFKNDPIIAALKIINEPLSLVFQELSDALDSILTLNIGERNSQTEALKLFGKISRAVHLAKFAMKDFMNSGAYTGPDAEATLKKLEQLEPTLLGQDPPAHYRIINRLVDQVKPRNSETLLKGFLEALNGNGFSIEVVELIDEFTEKVKIIPQNQEYRCQDHVIERINALNRFFKAMSQLDSSQEDGDKHNKINLIRSLINDQMIYPGVYDPFVKRIELIETLAHPCYTLSPNKLEIINASEDKVDAIENLALLSVSDTVLDLWRHDQTLGARFVLMREMLSLYEKQVNIHWVKVVKEALNYFSKTPKLRSENKPVIVLYALRFLNPDLRENEAEKICKVFRDLSTDQGLLVTIEHEDLVAIFQGRAQVTSPVLTIKED